MSITLNLYQCSWCGKKFKAPINPGCCSPKCDQEKKAYKKNKSNSKLSYRRQPSSSFTTYPSIRKLSKDKSNQTGFFTRKRKGEKKQRSSYNKKRKISFLAWITIVLVSALIGILLG